MGVKRHQSQCKECGYIWYPREKKEDCPKCKSASVAHTRGWGRWVLVIVLLGAVGAAGVASWFTWGQKTDPAPAKTEEPKMVPGPPADEGESGPAPQVSEEQPVKRETTNPPEPSETLTGMRTWTAKNGRTLEATLLRLELVDGQYVGHFEKPGGETFDYKIGNLSRADVDIVKGLVGQK